MIELLLTLWLALTAPQAAYLTHAPGTAGGERGPGIDPMGIAATAGPAEPGDRGPMIDPMGVPLGGTTAATGEEDSDLGPGIDPMG